MEPILSDDFEEEEMKHPAYNLRTNKAVDRLILVNILRRLDQNCKEFTYYSLGGPFLEDLRIMDHFFPDMNLVSLESNIQTFKRQEFNRFSRRLELRKTTLADFLIHDYTAGSKDIFWLDYTDLEYKRLDEFQSLIKNVEPGSVVRITLRAEPPIDLSPMEGKISDTELVRVRKELEQSFRDEFDRLLTHLPNEGVFAKDVDFVQIVHDIVKRAASLAFDTTGNEKEFVPVQSSCYQDGTQMLSITGIVCLRSETSELKNKFRGIPFATLDWATPDRIDIPALSMKERLHLERFLPTIPEEDAGEVLFKALEYMIDNSTKRSKSQLKHYADCHREYPNFVRISI